MAFKGGFKGRVRGFGFGAKQAETIVFPDIELPDVKCVKEERLLASYKTRFESFWRSSAYHPDEEAGPKDAQSTEIERYSNRLKRKTLVNRGPLEQYLELTSSNFPRELLHHTKQGTGRSRKRVRWNFASGSNSDSGWQKLDLYEQREKQLEARGDKDKDEEDTSNSPAEFTIHGLWPEYNNGGWPSCCRKSNFNEREISTLLGGLEKYWPTLSCGSPSTCHGTKGTFWGHEWEKHGTCSYPVLKDEYNYFLAGLNLYLKYNLTTVFNEAGYLPSNTEKYPRGGIVSAIENAFHLTPSLKCSKGALVELYLCFYKDFQPRDCGPDYVTQNGKYSSKSSCPKYVSLPEFMMPGLNDIETEGVMEF